MRLAAQLLVRRQEGFAPVNRSTFFAWLGAPLVNSRWSWGAVRPTDGTVFLLVWQDRMAEVGGARLVQVVRRSGDDVHHKQRGGTFEDKATRKALVFSKSAQQYSVALRYQVDGKAFGV